MKQVAVLGAGALGMLLAGKLAAAGCPAALWTRTEPQAEWLRARGVTLEDRSGGSKTVVKMEAIPWREAAAGFTGTLLVTVKQTAMSRELLHSLSGVLAKEAAPVFFQNGVGHMEAAAAALPGVRLAAAVTTEGALRTGAVSVRHTGIGETWIGEWETGTAAASECSADSPFQEVVRMMKQAGFSVSLSNEIRERMLRKLLINAVINPLTALWRVNNGALPETSERRSVMEALLRETADVLRTRGLSGAAFADQWGEVLGICAATAANRSSMLQDVLAGRETEIDALNGAVLRMARAEGMQAPWNAAVTALVKAILSPKERGV